jgi:hypothetical protein
MIILLATFANMNERGKQRSLLRLKMFSAFADILPFQTAKCRLICSLSALYKKMSHFIHASFIPCSALNCKLFSLFINLERLWSLNAVHFLCFTLRLQRVPLSRDLRQFFYNQKKTKRYTCVKCCLLGNIRNPEVGRAGNTVMDNIKKTACFNMAAPLSEKI